MRRSITVFPKLTDKEVSAIVETRKQYARAFNMSVDCLVTNNSTSKRFLHKVQYERIKEECPTLPTGLIQCARDVAVEAVKTWNVKRTKLKQKHPKRAERMKRPSMKEKCTMRYDVRTVTLRGSQLTFSTCDRRIRTIILIPGFFTERYPETDGWKLKHATIKETAGGRFFVSLVFDAIAEDKPIIKDPVLLEAFDYSMPDFAVSASGEYDVRAEDTHWFRNLEAKIAREHRKLSRMVKDSANYIQQQKRIGRLYEKAAGRRRSFLHKLSKDVVASSEAVIVEDINLRDT